MKKKSLWLTLMLLLVLVATNASASGTSANDVVMSWGEAFWTWVDALVEALRSWWPDSTNENGWTTDGQDAPPPMEGFGPGVVPNG